MMLLTNHVAFILIMAIILGYSFRVVGDDADADADDDQADDDDSDADDDAADDDDDDTDDDDGPETGIDDTDDAPDDDIPATAAPAPGAVPAVDPAAGTVKPAPPKVSSYLTPEDRAMVKQWREQGMDEDDIQVEIIAYVTSKREQAREAADYYLEMERRENPEMIDNLRPEIKKVLSLLPPEVSSTPTGVNQAIAQAMLNECARRAVDGVHLPLSKLLAEFAKGGKAAPAASRPPKTPSPPTTRIPNNGQSGNGARATATVGKGTAGKMKELYS